MTRQRLRRSEKRSVLRVWHEPRDSRDCHRERQGSFLVHGGEKKVSESKEHGYGRAFHLPLCCKAPVEINGAFKYINGLQRHP